MSYDTLPSIVRYIEQTYGHVVQVNNKPLAKYGENPSVGTTEATLQELSGAELSETYVGTNAIDSIVCDDDGFTGDVYIEGHTISGSDLTFVTQTVAATGQTPASLTTPLCRMTRLRNASAQTITATKKVYGYVSGGTVTAGVPQVDSAVKCIMSAEENSSLKCATAISSTQYFAITSLGGGVNKKTQGGGIFRLKVRPSGGVFQTRFKASSNSLGAPIHEVMSVPILVLPNSDIAMTCETDATTAAWGRFAGFLLDIQNP